MVDVIYKFFPRAIDKLEKDQGLFDGPIPKLLMVESIPDLTLMLLGHQRSVVVWFRNFTLPVVLFSVRYFDEISMKFP